MSNVLSSSSDSLSIYLHVPFCTTRCTYCAFNTYTNLEYLVPEFVDALIAEIRLNGANNTYVQVHSVYFGGGTPSLLSAGQLAAVLVALHESFRLTSDCEITMEANPNDLSARYLADLRAIGIDRLSIGLQSANDDELVLFARDHNATDVAGVMRMVRAAGFDNVSLDLIYGLPGQSLSAWQRSVDYLISLQPDHASLYALGLEVGTAMYAGVRSGRLPEPDDDLSADMYDLATDALAKTGYVQYEISNWSKLGMPCVHNLQYWRNLPYVGMGPGAHGYAGGVRYATVRSPRRYINLMRDTVASDYRFPQTPATVDVVAVGHGDEMIETLITGLRLINEGIDRSVFCRRFGVDVLEKYGDILIRFKDSGLLTIDNEYIRITRQGRLLTNLIFRELV